MIQFSFLIPVYNCGQSLRSCVESVLGIAECNRTIPMEIVLIDDGSTDGSGELCDQIAAAPQSKGLVRVFHQENQGVSAARNRGIDLAQGEYIIFIDSDDTIDSGRMSEILEQVAGRPDIDMAVYGISFDYYLEGKCFRRDEMLPPFSGVVAREEWMGSVQRLFETNVLSALWNKVIRKSILKEHDLNLREDMIIFEDLEISLRMMAFCDKILFCPEPVYHYVHIGHEDNAGRRLKRIAHIPQILDSIETGLKELSRGDGEQRGDILLQLYQNLASEKIKVSSGLEIKMICSDFHQWIDDHGYLPQLDPGSYLRKVYDGKARSLFWKSRVTKVRHRLANWVKLHIGDFRKWFH